MEMDSSDYKIPTNMYLNIISIKIDSKAIFL